MDLLLGVLGPRGVVELGNVHDNVLNAGNQDLALGISLAHHIIQGRENLLLEHRSIALADSRVVLPDLTVLRAYILLVLNIEGLLGVSFAFLVGGQGPVIDDDTFEA